MIDPSRLREHMEVVGADGGHVGKIDHIRGSEIELAKLDTQSGLKHHLIPVVWIEAVDGDTVRLSLTRDEAKARWTQKP